MPLSPQVLSKMCPRYSAVGFVRFLGKSANWMPLSVSTIWILYGATLMKALRKSEAVCCLTFSCRLRIGELRDPVYRHEEIQLAFLGADFRDVDMEVADRIDFECFLAGLVAFHLRQSGNAVALAATMQR
jgi:hypothetical protein